MPLSKLSFLSISADFRLFTIEAMCSSMTTMEYVRVLCSRESLSSGLSRKHSEQNFLNVIQKGWEYAIDASQIALATSWQWSDMFENSQSIRKVPLPFFPCIRCLSLISRWTSEKVLTFTLDMSSYKCCPISSKYSGFKSEHAFSFQEA